MENVKSKVTAQGQISVPAEVRRKLGVGPGSVLEWVAKDGAFEVRRAGLHTSAEIHRRLFPRGAPTVEAPIDTKAAIRKHMRKKHAGR
ncbi:MAG: AbrB/MazE/SpoVT family DNA-binding domain-containing protein [Proteobacteria bacterium]|nr:AbrB/MazE/SpoVT family DNA-binding domain-containing protein [Pseudomonadota bacterium]